MYKFIGKKIEGQEYWSFEDNKKYLNMEFLLLFFLPFVPEIISVIIFTLAALKEGNLNFYFPKTENEFFFKLKVIWKFSSFFLIAMYLLIKNKGAVFQDPAFYFFFAQVGLKCMTYGGNYLSDNNVFKDLIEIFTAIVPIGLMLHYSFSHFSVINAWRRLTNTGGYLDEDGNFILPHNSRMCKDKIYEALQKVLFYTLIALCAGMFIAFIVKFFVKEEAATNNQEKINVAFKEHLFSTVFIVLVVAPISEEFIFRHWIMKNNTGIISIFVSAFLFALAHVHREGIITLSLYLAPAFVFSYVYWKYKNLFLNIAIHSLFNFVVVLQMLW